jgi:acyl-CoA reductase-like NAD-dependent aldehyde dehydrogenase
MAAAPSVERATMGAKSTAAVDFLRGAPKQLLIGGKWTAAKSGKTFESINPANEEVLAVVAEGDKADIDEAVKAARKAFEEGKWPSMGPHQRTRLLLKIADLIEQHADELTTLETLDNGVPLMVTQGMVTGAVETFRYYAGWPTKVYGRPIRPIPRCSITRCASRSASAGR